MKERLTGAIILVALIVLLVPELLTGPIRTKPARAASEGRVHLANAQPPLRTYTLTLTPQAPTGDVLAAAQEQAQPAQSAPQSPAPPPTDAPKRSAAGAGLQIAKSPAHAPLRKERVSGASGGWVVQLGSFASRQNADRLARSLEARGFRMSVSRARAGRRLLWRVRAGPARDRARAEHLATRLRALGHRGELLPLS